MPFKILTLFFITSALFSNEAPARSPVFVAPVKAVSLTEDIEAVGTVQALDSIVVTSDNTRKAIEIHFKDGQLVQKGDLLVTLDKREEQAELNAAKARLNEKERAYNRAKQLRKQDVIADANYQEKFAEYKTALGDYEAINARIALLEIRAPFSGITGLIDISVGTLVQPGDKITTLDNLEVVEVEFYVPSRYVPLMHKGILVEAKTDAYEETFKGVLNAIDTQVDTVTRTIRVRAQIENKSMRLKPGMLMTITVLANPQNAMIIPEEAIVKRGQKNMVFSIAETEEGSIAKMKAIEIGMRKNGDVEVLSGLKVGEKVIHHGLVKVRDNTPVTVKAVENVNSTLNEMLGK